MVATSSIRNKTMKDQRVAGKRTNNPVAKQLSDPMWRKRVVFSKVVYNRKKIKGEYHDCEWHTSHREHDHAGDGSLDQRSSLD